MTEQPKRYSERCSSDEAVEATAQLFETLKDVLEKQSCDTILLFAKILANDVWVQTLDGDLKGMDDDEAADALSDHFSMVEGDGQMLRYWGYDIPKLTFQPSSWLELDDVEQAGA